MQAATAKKSYLVKEIAALRKEAAKLNTPSTYAKCAKYQRLANNKEKELAKLDSTAAPAWHGQVDKAVGTMQVRMHGWAAWDRCMGIHDLHGRWH